jgi:hypothetical protein
VILEIVPNWTETWTKAEVEKELINFAFNGIGWYFDNNGGAMLVSDSAVKTDRAGNEEEKRYLFHYWSASPIASFNWIANAPVIEDLRK